MANCRLTINDNKIESNVFPQLVSQLEQGMLGARNIEEAFNQASFAHTTAFINLYQGKNPSVSDLKNFITLSLSEGLIDKEDVFDFALEVKEDVEEQELTSIVRNNIENATLLSKDELEYIYPAYKVKYIIENKLGMKVLASLGAYIRGNASLTFNNNQKPTEYSESDFWFQKANEYVDYNSYQEIKEEAIRRGDSFIYSSPSSIQNILGIKDSYHQVSSIVYDESGSMVVEDLNYFIPKSLVQSDKGLVSVNTASELMKSSVEQQGYTHVIGNLYAPQDSVVEVKLDNNKIVDNVDTGSLFNVINEYMKVNSVLSDVFTFDSEGNLRAKTTITAVQSEEIQRILPPSLFSGLYTYSKSLGGTNMLSLQTENNTEVTTYSNSELFPNYHIEEYKGKISKVDSLLTVIGNRPDMIKVEGEVYERYSGNTYIRYSDKNYELTEKEIDLLERNLPSTEFEGKDSEGISRLEVKPPMASLRELLETTLTGEDGMLDDFVEELGGNDMFEQQVLNYRLEGLSDYDSTLRATADILEGEIFIGNTVVPSQRFQELFNILLEDIGQIKDNNVVSLSSGNMKSVLFEKIRQLPNITGKAAERLYNKVIKQDEMAEMFKRKKC